MTVALGPVRQACGQCSPCVCFSHFPSFGISSSAFQKTSWTFLSWAGRSPVRSYKTALVPHQAGGFLEGPHLDSSLSPYCVSSSLAHGELKQSFKTECPTEHVVPGMSQDEDGTAS